jgi:hypothetical protein
MLLSVCACWCGMVWNVSVCQHLCKKCGHLFCVKEGERHQLCRTCNVARVKHVLPAAAAPPPSAPSLPPPLFDSHAGNHGPLSLLQRAAVVVLEKEGHLRKDIAAKVGTSVPSVHIEVGKHGRRWVQRPVGTAFNPEYTYQQDEATEQVTLWGCFCAKEIGQAEIFIGEFDARKYVGILRANLIPSYRKFFPSGQWYFQQDNAPQHTSAAARAWFHNNGITVLDFPPWSPDLNPIENLWADFKQRVEQHHALTAEELETAMKVEWEGTDNSLLTKLVHSMPDRLSQVINNQGHTTKY